MFIKLSYLIGSLVVLSIWLLIFCLRKDLRKMMLQFSPFIAIYGAIAEHWFFKDYWRPTLIINTEWKIGSIEDLIFGFAIGGIAVALYKLIFRKTLYSNPIAENKNWAIIIFPAVVFAISIFLINILHFNSIFSFSLSFITVLLIIFLQRRDLIFPATMTGIFLSLIMFIIYYFYLPLILDQTLGSWLISNTPSGYLILGRVPLSEMIWAFTFGTVAGTFYEFATNSKLIPLANRSD